MTNDQPVVDYDVVLADIEVKIAKLTAVADGIRDLRGILQPSNPAPERQSTTAQSETLGPGAFLGMSIVDASKKYLAAKRQSQRTDEILKALTDGGIVLSGASPLNVVGSVLNRNYTSGGDIVKVARGVWGLAAWHPRLRKKAGTVEPPTEDFSDLNGEALSPPLDDQSEATAENLATDEEHHQTTAPVEPPVVGRRLVRRFSAS